MTANMKIPEEEKLRLSRYIKAKVQEEGQTVKGVVNKMNELYKEYDAMILPASGGIAPKFDGSIDRMSDRYLILENHLAIGNFGGFPSITIPSGFVNNMPIGINITGRCFEDALTLSKELELTLTGRDCGAEYGRIPLAGIPAKAINPYLEKLVEKNYRIAICEQLEDPKYAKGLVKRGVTRIITAGTLTESDFLQQNSNNYICAMFKDEKTGIYGFAYADISTGEFKVTQAQLNNIITELARIKPVEIVAPAINQKVMPFQIVPEQKIDLPDEIQKLYYCSKIPSRVFDLSFAENNLKALFETQSLESFGFSKYKLGFRAGGALLSYLWETLKENIPKFERIEAYDLSEYMILDSSTRKNLELTETLREKKKYGSLLWAIDKTKTNMGSRLLKNWICQPLKNIQSIIVRQNAISELVEKTNIRKDLIDELEKVYDIQRLATRLSNNSASPRDFLSLRDSLSVLPRLLDITQNLENNPFIQIEGYRLQIQDFVSIIDKTIVDDPPVLIKEGGIIKPNVDGKLDYYRDLLDGGEKWLQNFIETEREKTGIKNLKVSYNKVFGYYIEVTNSNLNIVPPNYIRKQTLTSGERFITEELKKHEDDVLSAKFKSTELEYTLFTNFREYSKEFVSIIREISECISLADVYSALAEVAAENNYCRPEINESDEFLVKNGRHAVLEKILPLGEYVANDLELKTDKQTQFMILTGPNMAGKSTYMRQNALIVLLAQIGSWVPADYVRLGIVDKIFTRVGASDDLTLGQSTFMVHPFRTRGERSYG